MIFWPRDGDDLVLGGTICFNWFSSLSQVLRRRSLFRPEDEMTATAGSPFNAHLATGAVSLS